MEYICESIDACKEFFMSMYYIIPHHYPEQKVRKPKVRKKSKKDLSMHEAFETMHKQDGTSEGRRKCVFAL